MAFRRTIDSSFLIVICLGETFQQSVFLFGSFCVSRYGSQAIYSQPPSLTTTFSFPIYFRFPIYLKSYLPRRVTSLTDFYYLSQFSTIARYVRACGSCGWSFLNIFQTSIVTECMNELRCLLHIGFSWGRSKQLVFGFGGKLLSLTWACHVKQGDESICLPVMGRCRVCLFLRRIQQENQNAPTVSVCIPTSNVKKVADEQQFCFVLFFHQKSGRMCPSC